MTTSQELFLAILSMDAYNRGYHAGIDNGVGDDDGLGDSPGTSIGDAMIVGHSIYSLGSAQRDAGFYSIAYQIGSQTVISYRGTDSTLELPLTDFPIIGGDYNEAQVYMAAQFYNSVRDQVGQNAVERCAVRPVRSR